MKLTEVCDLVATLCVCESELTGRETHKKVTDIEAVTIDGKLIVENYKLNIDDAINSSSKEIFPLRWIFLYWTKKQRSL